MKKWALIILKIAVTVGLMAWLLRGMNLTEAAGQLKRADPGYLVLTLLIVWFGHFLCVLRWKALLGAFGIAMRTLSLVLIYFTGSFFNLVFPGLVGGDLVKTYLAGRESRNSYSLTFSSVFLDRDIGFVAMILIAVAAALAYPLKVQGYNMLLVFTALLTLCVAANVILFHPGAHRLVMRLLSSDRLAGMQQRLHLLAEAFGRVRQNVRVLSLSLFLSLVNQLIVVLSSYLLARSLGIEAPFRYFLVFIPAIIVITMIPISINGVGLREFAYMSFFSTIGVSTEEGVLLGFLSSLLIIVSGLPGGLAYLLYRGEVSQDRLVACEAGLTEESHAS